MLHSIKLLLPVLIPSWRFFSAVAPSPRVEYQLLGAEHTPMSAWQEFRPRPAHISLRQMINRMLWNPHWNEGLFLVSCAERLMEAPTQHSVDEIRTRITRDIMRGDTAQIGKMQFRLVFVHREGDLIVKEIEYESDIFALDLGNTHDI